MPTAAPDPTTPVPTEPPATELPATPEPTAEPTPEPTAEPTPEPTPEPETGSPSEKVTPEPTAVPTAEPTPTPTPNPGGRRTIYLTFDDGPCANTRQVLDILDRYGVKATFFTVGYFVDRYPAIAAQIMDRGHLIACHTYSHDPNTCYASAQAFMNDVHQWEAAVIRACGRLPGRVCVRFPGGSTTASARNVRDQIFRLLREGGYRWFDWTAGDNDKWPAGNTDNLPIDEYLWQSYLTSINWHQNSASGAQVIFLSHDTEDATVRVLPRIIEDLIARGYEFRTLDQHPDWNR